MAWRWLNQQKSWRLSLYRHRHSSFVKGSHRRSLAPERSHPAVHRQEFQYSFVSGSKRNPSPLRMIRQATPADRGFPTVIQLFAPFHLHARFEGALGLPKLFEFSAIFPKAGS